VRDQAYRIKQAELDSVLKDLQEVRADSRGKGLLALRVHAALRLCSQVEAENARVMGGIVASEQACIKLVSELDGMASAITVAASELRA